MNGVGNIVNNTVITLGTDELDLWRSFSNLYKCQITETNRVLHANCNSIKKTALAK